MKEQIKLVCIKEVKHLTVGEIYTGNKLSRLKEKYWELCDLNFSVNLFDHGYFISNGRVGIGWFSTNVVIPLAEYRDNQINNILEFFRMCSTKKLLPAASGPSIIIIMYWILMCYICLYICPKISSYWILVGVLYL